MRNYFIRRNATVCLKEVTCRLTDGGDILLVPSDVFDLLVHLVDGLLSLGGSHAGLQYHVESASQGILYQYLGLKFAKCKAEIKLGVDVYPRRLSNAC